MKQLIYPKSYLTVPITKGLKSIAYVETVKGVEKEIPPFQIRITCKDPNLDDTDISHLLKSISELELNIESPLKDRVNKIHHKLTGIKYHKMNFGKEEDKCIQEFEREYHADNLEFIIDNSILTFETEAFLFQFKSTLDLLTQIIRIVFKIKLVIVTYGAIGEDLIHILKNNTSKDLQIYAAKIIELINENKKWLADLIDMRDEVTHWSDLEGLSSFIHTRWDEKETIPTLLYPG